MTIRRTAVPADASTPSKRGDLAEGAPVMLHGARGTIKSLTPTNAEMQIEANSYRRGRIVHCNPAELRWSAKDGVWYLWGRKLAPVNPADIDGEG